MPMACLYRAVSILALLLPLAAAFVGKAQAAEVSAERPAEFMIYQYPDSVLVLRLDVPETEFAARVTGPDSALVQSAEIRGRRLGPVFLYIDDTAVPRQLMIEVAPARPVDRATIGFELIRYGADDPNSRGLVQAYRLLSHGAAVAHGRDSATWSDKAWSFRNAAQIFAQLGREEMRLWSEYFAAQLALYRLDDRLSATELARVVRPAAQRAGFPDIETAAAVLEAEARQREVTVAQGPPIAGTAERAREALAVATRLTEQQGLRSEQARVLYLDGLVLERQQETAQALDRYRLALDTGMGHADPELLNEVRAAAAAAYERLGRTDGAIEMLEEMTGTPAAAQAAREEAAVLAAQRFEKGRLLNAAMRYSEAAAELGEALAAQRQLGGGFPWAPTALELAWSLAALGRDDEAQRLLDEALPRTPRQGNEAILARAWGSLADMHRSAAEFGQMQWARERQADLLGDEGGRGAWLFEAALDAFAQDGRGSARARRLLEESAQIAGRSGDSVTMRRAQLRRCLAGLEQDAVAACDEAAAAHQLLRDSGLPWIMAESTWIWARIQHRSGRAREARQAMDLLTAELLWYLRDLPGALGAWYPAQRQQIADDLLRQALTTQDAVAALLAQEQTRALDQAFAVGGHATSRLESTVEGRLRSALARRAAASAAEIDATSAAASRELAAARRGCADCGGSPAPSRSDLERQLGQLAADEVLLSYYLSDSSGWVITAGRAGVNTRVLPGFSRIVELMDQVRPERLTVAAATARADLDELGRLLLAPVATDLRERVYLLSAGSLNGLPFDALRLDGHYLGASRQVLNITSLGSLQRRRPILPSAARDRVFLAGNPQTQRDPFSLELTVSPEIAAVTDAFVGPGLHIVQGVALLPDEFADARLAEAGLVHLAIPGTLDLVQPERSRLQLSVGPAGAANVLEPADVAGLRLAANLVVLSGTAVSGRSASAFDSRLPFVSEFCEAGAAAVVASLWSVPPTVVTGFMRDFYGELETNPDIAQALWRTRRSRIDADTATDLATWAGFQLFIR
jgi:CHAT domain-containing protein